MSYAVHTKPIDALEWADIEALVTDGAEESATLEFKSAGIWGDVATNWWDGVANTNWVAANPDAAIFGVSNGAAGTVTVNGTTTVASLLFNPPGSGAYAIAGGTLVLANDATITANASATIGSRRPSPTWLRGSASRRRATSSTPRR